MAHTSKRCFSHGYQSLVGRGGKGDGTTMSNAEGGNKGGRTQRSGKEGEGCKANDVDGIAIMRD